MDGLSINKDIFLKPRKSVLHEQEFNISPLLFRGGNISILSDITDTNKLGTRLLNLNKILLDPDFLPELSEYPQHGGYSETNTHSIRGTRSLDNISEVSTTSEIVTSNFSQTGGLTSPRSLTPISLPFNFIDSASSLNSFSYTTESGLTTSSHKKYNKYKK